jgi:hypothetical protein
MTYQEMLDYYINNGGGYGWIGGGGDGSDLRGSESTFGEREVQFGDQILQLGPNGSLRLHDPGSSRAQDATATYVDYYPDGTMTRGSYYTPEQNDNTLYAGLALVGGAAAAGLASTYFAGAGLSEAATGALTMDTAALDSLIAQQSAAYEASALAAAENGILGSTVGSGAAAAPAAIPTVADTIGSVGGPTPPGAYTTPALGGPFQVPVPYDAGTPAAAGIPGAGIPSVGTPTTSPTAPPIPGTGAPPTSPTGQPTAPAGPTSPTSPTSAQQTLLERLLGGNVNPTDLANLLGGLSSAIGTNRFGDQMLQRAADATPNRTYYETLQRDSYENPARYLDSPEVRAGADLTLNRLQRSDATKGQLANSTGRQVTLNNYMMDNLAKYRQGLQTTVGQNQQTYTGQNTTAAQGYNADNSWMNGLLWSLGQR